MSAIGGPLRGPAARKVDSAGRHGQLEVELVVYCALGRGSPWVLECPCRAVEEDLLPGLYPRGGGEVSAGG
jgi:hypothetical protein